jgi:hypothetical protein
MTPSSPAPNPTPEPNRGSDPSTASILLAVALTPMITLSPSLHRLAAQGVRIENEAEVATFLKQHPNLEPVTNALIQNARKQLPAHTELSVEFYRDPEATMREIVVWGRLKDYPNDMRARIKAAETAARHQPKLRALIKTCADHRAYSSLMTDYGPPQTR